MSESNASAISTPRAVRRTHTLTVTAMQMCIRDRHAGGGEMNRDEMYLSLGVSEKVLAFGEAVLEELKPCLLYTSRCV